MNRRNLLKGAMVAPFLTASASAKEVIRYKNAEDIIWHEEICGEDVEFSCSYVFNFDSYDVRSWWRSQETPRKTYALSFRLTAEQISEAGDIPLVDLVRSCDRCETLRVCMSNTIRVVKFPGSPIIKKEGAPAFAPQKPEGCVGACI